ncbi:MAG: VOC family protein [Deltaproteobacteria bacterium]|nr:VOC family protein [Deltaproteobacteria bacterium]
MIKEVGHIGIAVQDIESTLDAFCRAMGLTKPVIRDFPDRKMRMALISLGRISLELLEDNSQDGMLARLVRERGSHIHHFCLTSDDLETDISELKEKGVKMANESPSIGLRGKRVLFAMEGILDDIPIELSEL